MTTPNLQLPEVPEAIQGASDELNDGFRTLDIVVQLAVLDKDLIAPPSDAQQGDRYIVPAGGLGIWAGRERHVAYFMPDGWHFAVPRPGWRARVLDEDTWYLFSDSDWAEDASGGGGASPLTTKGDLYTHDGTVDARLPSGPEGQYLRARAAESTGLKWEAASPVGEGASAARAYKNASQSIADATLTALTWPAEEFDTDAYHSTSVNTSRFTVSLDGKYQVGASIKWDSNTTGVRELYVVVSGVTGTRRAGSYLPAADGLIQEVHDTLTLVAGDYVEFFVRQNSTAARDVVTLEQITSAFIARVGVTAAPTLMRGATWVRTVGNIQTPVNDVHVRCPVKGTIVGVTVGTTGGPGSAVIDIWKDTHANYPPTVADSICASAKPTLSSVSKYEDTTLTGWTTAIAAGDWLVFHLESSGAFKAIFVQLYIKETQ